MNIHNINLLLRCCLTSSLLVITLDVYAAEWLADASVRTQLEYNDNIFLTSLPHDSVSAFKITPSVSAIVREANWQANLNARITNNNYSDHTLDSNDEYYTLTGSYSGERNIFSLSASYILDSNLSSVSSDFGIFGRRINREVKRLSPSYTHLLTERSTLVFSYSYNETDYLDDAGSRVPFELQTLSGSYIYDLTEKDEVSISLQVTDYKSGNNRTEYVLLTSRFGIEHDFSETLSADFLVGVSRQQATNRFDRVINFLGRPIIITQETESSNRSLVLDAGFEKTFETSSVKGRVSRSDVTDSFGNLNQVDSFSASYQHKLSELWRYTTNARYEDIAAVNSAAGNNTSVDRKILFFDTIVSYKLTREWTASFSYRYVLRRFNSDISDNRAPHSNLIYAAINYNFPSLTTF